jgi:hypothetical protein
MPIFEAVFPLNLIAGLPIKYFSKNAGIHETQRYTQNPCGRYYR